MMMTTRFAAAVIAALLALAAPTASAVDMEAFLKRAEFDQVKISPTGEYLAATVPMEEGTALAVVRLSDNKITGGGTLGKNRHVADMWWVNDTRLLFSSAERMGLLDKPRLTGNLYATEAEGKGAEVMVGQSVETISAGTRIGGKKTEMVAAFLVDPLRDNDREVIISVQSLLSEDPYTRAEKMNVYSGRRMPITRAPVRNGRFVTDHAGEVRAVYGITPQNSNQLYVRTGEGGDWQLLNDEASTHRTELPIGFSSDNATLYILAERQKGPDVIEAYDTATGRRRELLADDDRDPERIIYSAEEQVPVGARYMDGKPRTAFFDQASGDARLYRSLEAAFQGEAPFVTSKTTDGKTVLVEVASDRNAGDFYLYDTVAKKARHVLSRRSWLDPEEMAEARPVAFAARDGLPLTGYLTVPKGAGGKSMPLVVMPHGGPFGVYEGWIFDDDSQLLAAAGYAVLRIDFRGSGNHGRAFQQAGAREWGGKMQDDVTDATHWAIREGIADPARICIHGGSYGAYTALMGVAREPSLYACASGYVGVYDLPKMQADDARDHRRLGYWSKDWVGDDKERLAATSPNRIADQIKVPVFLAAGGEDEIAPIEHSKMMERALVAAGVPVETLYYPTEGHGFYRDASRREYHSRLLAFLARHLGTGATATGAAGE